MEELTNILCEICEQRPHDFIVQDGDETIAVCQPCDEDANGVVGCAVPNRVELDGDTVAEQFRKLGDRLDADGSLSRDREQLETEIAEDEYIQYMADRLGGAK